VGSKAGEEKRSWAELVPHPEVGAQVPRGRSGGGWLGDQVLAETWAKETAENAFATRSVKRIELEQFARAHAEMKPSSVWT
jgi:hypothetical protein